MKLKLYLSILILFSLSTSAQQRKVVSPSSDCWYANASAWIKQLEYDFHPKDNNEFRVVNPANRIGFLLTEKGYSAYSLQDGNDAEPWNIVFSLKTIGREKENLQFVNSSFSKEEKTLSQHFGFADVEYTNDEKGLRQNFIINERPAGNGNLEIKIGLESSLAPAIVNGTALVFSTNGNDKNVKLIYDDLKVWDAANKTLAAHMELNDKRNILSLVIDDKDAQYPVTVDPLNKTPEWTTSADGILPSLLNNMTLQAQSLYGYAVSGLGDINNDGFDDVAVGAPGMADVISGSGSLLGVGAVFIYLGSADGLHTTPGKILQPATAIAGALFGASIAAGNITADGINDILIGAPLDTYQTSAQGLLGSVNVNVTAGKVYFYRSEDLFAVANPSPFLSIRLQGTNFFSTGVAGLLLSNVSVKGLFGFSVAVTNDLNGDGREDIIIGAPAYVGVELLSVKSGAAYVYYSNNLSTTSPVELAVPTPSLLGLISLPLANLNGLLFGFCVEGAGDYNNDGKPDVVVGAPAGVDLSSLGGIFSGQVLGGSAYVYYGTGSGVSTSIGATLQASSSGLLSNAANLFGYKIKAVKNASGVRNGNILVSAPTGGVLSNIVGGLRLKAGQVHVFKKKTTAFSGVVTSDQVLSSPRSSSVLSLLTSQNLNVSMLYGAGIDNILDVSCDGNADIIIGEPLSTNVPVIGANITGGAAYVYLGNPDGTYDVTPAWDLSTTVSSLVGINATSLVGFGVAGAGHIYGASEKPRVLVGGPSNTLDFGSGLLNLGNTLGTTFNFVFDNNGLGKSYVFSPDLCGLRTLPTTLISFRGAVVDKTVQLTWTTLMEQNVDRYELQRSTDGVFFTMRALILAYGGQRNDYNFPDKYPLPGVNYYRLRIIDKDGKYVYSNIISARFDKKVEGHIVVTPNPIQEDVKVKMTGFIKGVYNLRLYNSSGDVVQSKKINLTMPEQTEIMERTQNMAAGVYWLSIYDINDKLAGSVRLMITRK
jgi:hypothetical protein